MSRKLISLSAATFFIGSTAIADVPSVATDIAPVHSFVSNWNKLVSSISEDEQTNDSY